MLKAAEAIHEQLIAWRRDIHAHPELGFQEHRTARLVADTLEGFGRKFVDFGLRFVV